MKILSRSFYAEILALQGFPAGLRASYFIRDNFDYPEFRNNQSFSVAGARRGFSDPRGTLFFEIARLVEARHPAYLILENVPGLLKHTPQSLKNVLSIMYSKEDILFAALKVNPARIDSYCQAVDEPILEEIRKLPSGASMDQLKDRWYQGRDGSDYHYHSSRYRACYAQKKVMLRIF